MYFSEKISKKISFNLKIFKCYIKPTLLLYTHNSENTVF